MVRLYHSLILAFLGSAVSYQRFKDIIPNGNIIPHPCKSNYLWHGVGHNNPLGGGSRNSFGVDFNNANKQWTTELCNKDSDGDGRTNGEELGDPACTWTSGQIPAKVTGLSHPGICTEADGSICAKDKEWVDCDVTDRIKDCEAMQEPETQNITIRFPETDVPKEETSYVCMIFNLPSESDFHLVAYEPFLDNKDVMHHIILYGCDPTDPVAEEHLNKVSECGMGAGSKCQTVIGLWAVGFPGYCVEGPTGYKFGASGYKQAALEFHWNNPMNVETYKDASGMTLYYTPKLRPNDAAVMMVGQLDLEIPPKSQDVIVEGKCSSECSRTLITGPVNVFWATNHMHYLGHKMKIEVYRNGVFYTELTNDEIYNYDSPVEHKYSTAIQVLPGDEIVTTCHFKSLSRSKTTFYGEATNDEMCFGFISFYPASNVPFPNCLAWKSIPICNMWMTREHENCKWYDFLIGKGEANTTKNLVNDNCRPLLGCTAECKDILRRLYAEDPCMQGDIHKFMRQNSIDYNNLEMQRFFAAADSCAVDLAIEALGGVGDGTNGSRCQITVNYLLLVFVACFFLFQ